MIFPPFHCGCGARTRAAWERHFGWLSSRHFSWMRRANARSLGTQSLLTEIDTPSVDAARERAQLGNLFGAFFTSHLFGGCGARTRAAWEQSDGNDPS